MSRSPPLLPNPTPTISNIHGRHINKTSATLWLLVAMTDLMSYKKKKNHIYSRFRIDTTGSSDALLLMGICVCFIPRVGSNRCYLSPSRGSGL